MMTKNHYYFLLHFNPWPVLASISSFNMMISLLYFFKFFNYFLLLSSIANMFLISFMWWIFYSNEYNTEGFSSFVLELGLKCSMILFISSEIFFFFSFFWSYFHFFLSPMVELGACWPPLSLVTFNASNIPLINTLILLMSGVTVTISHLFLMKGEMKKNLFFLIITIFLGFIFTIFQIQEYNNSFFSLSDSNFGSTFFILTGFHGIHVLVGSIFLMVVFTRFFKLISSKEDSLSFDLASWYWHFVDVVWIFLYFFLYYLNN